jgi:hypothetical protein
MGPLCLGYLFYFWVYISEVWLGQNGSKKLVLEMPSKIKLVKKI